jgi:hypothetical protein
VASSTGMARTSCSTTSGSVPSAVKDHLRSSKTEKECRRIFLLRGHC